MGRILCATRGGEASRRTQTVAITMARERGDELVFLYVVDMSFLDKMAAPIVVDVESQVEKMGDFLLAMAREEAARQGISADVVIRHGQVREQIQEAVVTEGADVLVLGRPAGQTDVFALESLHAYAREMERETGVKVVIA
jgi:nucleotide-binding universal stress UspA family protein